MRFAVAICLLITGLAVNDGAYADETQTAAESKHVELDTTTIRSSSELPSVMAVVPWKKALPADLGGRPDKSLVEALLKPLDPEVFRLQLDFYEQLFVAKKSEPVGADTKTGER